MFSRLIYALMSGKSAADATKAGAKAPCPCAQAVQQPAGPVEVNLLTGVPAPRTSFAVKTGGAIGGARGIRVACLCALALVAIGAVVLALAWRRRARQLQQEKFFGTLYAHEEPTRSYIPYTGTIANGPWGTRPWAEAYDLETPEQAYGWYLPAPYHLDVL